MPLFKYHCVILAFSCMPDWKRLPSILEFYCFRFYFIFFIFLAEISLNDIKMILIRFLIYFRLALTSNFLEFSVLYVVYCH